MNVSITPNELGLDSTNFFLTQIDAANGGDTSYKTALNVERGVLKLFWATLGTAEAVGYVAYREDGRRFR